MDHARPQSNAKAIRRAVFIGTSVLLVVSGGVTLANIDFSTQRVDRDKLSIETVQKGTLEIKVSANGQLLPKNIEQLASQISGRVAKAHVKPGALVTAGQLLVELTNPQLIASEEEARSAWEGAVIELRAAESELQNNLLNQESAVTRAQFDMEKAQLQLEAEARLIDQKIISEIDFKRTKLNVAQLSKSYAIEQTRLQKTRDNIQVQLAVRQSRVTQLARALDRAKNQTANLRVVAGIHGIVQAIGVEIGQQLQPGSPIGRIAQQDQLYAELKVPAREATEVQAGQRVVIDTRNGTAEGVVARIDPGVTEGTVIVDVDLTGDLPASARPQLQVEGIVYLAQIPNTLFVGKPAYVKTNADISVYRLDASGEYASRMTIKAGKVSLNYLQVLAGLQVGDRIITSEIGEWQDKDRILLN